MAFWESLRWGAGRCPIWRLHCLAKWQCDLKECDCDVLKELQSLVARWKENLKKWGVTQDICTVLYTLQSTVQWKTLFCLYTTALNYPSWWLLHAQFIGWANVSLLSCPPWMIWSQLMSEIWWKQSIKCISHPTTLCFAKTLFWGENKIITSVCLLLWYAPLSEIIPAHIYTHWRVSV